MAKFDEKDLKFPSFEDDEDFEMYYKLISRNKKMDPSYDDVKIRQDLQKHERLMNKLSSTGSPLKKYRRWKKKQAKIKSEENVEEDNEELEGTTKIPIKSSNRKLYNYILKEREKCDNIEKKLEVIQQMLSNAKVQPPKSDIKFFEESKSEIKKVLEDFHELEKIAVESEEDTLDESGSESESDWEDYLKQKKEMHKEFDSNMMF